MRNSLLVLLLPIASSEDISLAALHAAKYTTQEAIDPASSDVYALLATLQHSPHTAEAEDAARELRSLVADGAHADAVVISGGVGDLLTLLRSGGAGAREQAAGVLRRLAFDAGRAMAVADAGAAALADNGVTTVASAWIADAHFGGWDATVHNATTGDADYTAGTVPWWVNRTDGERQTAPPPGVSWNGTVLKSEL